MEKQVKPCEKCGSNKWKTLEKGKRFKCRGLINKQVDRNTMIGVVRMTEVVQCLNIREI